VRREDSRRAELLRMKDAIRVRQSGNVRAEHSIFDVFWDLGASEFAIEVMAHQGFLPKEVDDLEIALDQLQDAIKVQGNYQTFIRENLEAIEEMYAEHRQAGNRRALPLLELRQHKTLELPAITGPVEPGKMPVHIDHSERREDMIPFLDQGTSVLEIDIDALVRVDPIAMLKSVFFGESEELARWWNMRTLRGMRNSLDEDLRRLYEAYVFEATRDPDYYRNLYDVAERWMSETRRIEDLEVRDVFKRRPIGVCARALLREAAAVSRKMANRARLNVDQTIELIHHHARMGNTAMAGYLIFLNHRAFFAGKTGRIQPLLQSIENTTYKMQSELRQR